MGKKIRIACFVAVFIIVFLIVYFSSVKHLDEDCYAKAAVASDVGKCSEIGRKMLKRGGSAVDAAIAALLCLGLFNPQSMGIGGGHFFLIYNSSTGKVETINARETAPGRATRDMFPNKELSQKGVLSIAVPGELRGYELAHRRHGRRPWRELFEPSIRLAREGIRISKALGDALNKSSEQGDIPSGSTLCQVFCDSNKTILRENDFIRFPRLAETYEKIAEGGADVFYNGSMAQTIVEDIQAAGGIITLEDLSGYTAELNENTVKIKVGEYTMHFPDAPSSGPVLALILNILDGYNFSSRSLSSEKETLTYHRIIEAFRFAFAKRTMLGDPRYLNIADLIHNMTSAYFANNIRSKISDETTHPAWYYEPEYSNPESYGTSHLSILAEDGSAVAVTSTINLAFGSKVMSTSTGIIFNNIMDDFSSPNFPNAFKVPPSPNNFIQAGKRPLSAMCPTIIFDKDNKVKMVVGAEGGTRIITTTALVILNSLYFNKNLKESVKECRVHNQLSPNTTVEDGFNKNLIKGLKEKNHNITMHNDTTPFSVVQAVLRWNDQICAESDQRKRGQADGY